MNIGIITFHYANNYGAIMQAYGLQSYLEQQGHKVEFINYRPREEKHFLKQGLRCVLSLLQITRGSWKNSRYTEKFHQILHVGEKPYTTFQQLEQFPPSYDLYITGSDQVWTPQFGGSYLEPAYFLRFAGKGARKIAYAASMGQCCLSEKNKSEMKTYLEDFDSISVREDKAKTALENMSLKQHIHRTLDPSLLAGREIFEKVAAPIPEKPDSYICAYLLDKLEGGHQQILRYLQNEEKCPIIRLRNPESCIRLDGGVNRFVSPEEWISYFMHSRMAVCGSFHALAFSLMFHKPFICMHSSEKEIEAGGDCRILSLLKPMGLDYRCFAEFDMERLTKCLETPIDWNKVDGHLEKLRQESIDFLTSSHVISQ